MIKHKVQHILSFAVVPNTMRPAEKCCNCAYEYEGVAPDKCKICGCEHSIFFEKEDINAFFSDEYWPIESSLEQTISKSDSGNGQQRNDTTRPKKQ